VCSNSLRANSLENAAGLLKEEMRNLGSLIISCADKYQVPAGGALAVDREKFAQEVTNRINNHPKIETVIREVESLDITGPLIIATGPLTEGKLAGEISKLTGVEYLYFYDAAAPIVTKDSINMGIAFKASRYGKGDDDYINCPMNEEEYSAFFKALMSGEQAITGAFEKQIFFEGCMPIEEMARRGIDTLRFGPMKPVGLVDPRTNSRPYAVVQLRQDNLEGTLYNIVGFQTKLKWPEQEKIFRLIPGLEAAEFVRFGVIHRNTFINSPKLLGATFNLKENQNLFFAGQITGVEGYIESAASGLVAGLNAFRLVSGKGPLTFPLESAIGALSNYISTAPAKSFQPMNINFGLLPSLPIRIKDKKAKNQELAKRALESLTKYIEENF
ncbi:MAG: methylenetetrahydrofolate--tRNA-(uracil(54)-C(5))-methyltransferase (FADH(2)-oxidizing) TrmFO, partial [Bacillota bacterium]|nr:methylenetetrahydrofolate--tRNA-(uracil(54)-C(5))-methyltransferase (FADH(2)-oxidizing) TrmFO [Bacillota bacterium]